MKVLIYTHGFAPEIGGVEMYAMLLAEGLSRSVPAAEGSEAPEVTVVTPTPAGGYGDSHLPFRVVRQPRLGALIELLLESDVVQLAGPCLLPLFLAWAMHRPVVVEQHGYQAACPNGLLFYEPNRTTCPGHFLARRYSECLRCNEVSVGWAKSLQMLLLTFSRRWLCHAASVNTPISHHLLKRLELPKARVIYYGIREPFGRISEPRAGAEASNHLCFTYVGRFVKERGAHVLLEAARLLQSSHVAFQLKFIGDGPERARLEDLAKSAGLGDRVSFTGVLRDQALERALEGTAAVVLPSLMEETAGMAAMEQMVRGRLVIVSNIGGLSEVVGDGGMKFAPGDAPALAECLRRVIDEPETVHDLCERARERALKLFQQKRMVQEHLDLYTDLIR